MFIVSFEPLSKGTVFLLSADCSERLGSLPRVTQLGRTEGLNSKPDLAFKQRAGPSCCHLVLLPWEHQNGRETFISLIHQSLIFIVFISLVFMVLLGLRKVLKHFMEFQGR